jgi:hypothetical protein
VRGLCIHITNQELQQAYSRFNATLFRSQLVTFRGAGLKEIFNEYRFETALSSARGRERQEIQQIRRWFATADQERIVEPRSRAGVPLLHACYRHDTLVPLVLCVPGPAGVVLGESCPRGSREVSPANKLRLPICFEQVRNMDDPRPPQSAPIFDTKRLDHEPRARCRLEFSGARGDRHHVVHLDGKPIRLSPVLFGALVDLVVALFKTETGFTRLRPSALTDEHARTIAARLRRRFDAVLGNHAGKALVVTGLGTEYRLNLLRSDVVFRDSFFSELPPFAARSELLGLVRSAGNRFDIPSSWPHACPSTNNPPGDAGRNSSSLP